MFFAFLDLIKLSISCFSWCHLKQCNSQERKYSWTFKYCVTKSLRRSSCVHLIAVALFHRMAWQRLWEVPMIHNLSLAPSWLLHFFVFFYILFALFCHISGDGIAATKSTIFPLAPSWLLHFSLFCVLKYFLPYCVIFQKAW